MKKGLIDKCQEELIHGYATDFEHNKFFQATTSEF